MIRQIALLAAIGLTAACGPKPEDVAQKFVATWNTNDAKAIVDAFADDPYVAVDDRKIINKEELTAWVTETLAKKPQLAVTTPLVNKAGKFDFSMALTREDWSRLGVGPLGYTAEMVVDGDKLKLFSWKITDDGKTQLKSKIDERNGKWLKAMQDGIKTRNPGAIKQLITADVRFDVPDKGTFGKDGIDDWVKYLNAGNITLDCCSKKESDEEWEGTMVSDSLKALKMESVVVETNADFGEDGHIKGIAIALPDAVKAKIESAKSAAAAAATAEAEKDSKKKKKK